MQEKIRTLALLLCCFLACGFAQMAIKTHIFCGATSHGTNMVSLINIYATQEITGNTTWECFFMNGLQHISLTVSAQPSNITYANDIFSYYFEIGRDANGQAIYPWGELFEAGQALPSYITQTASFVYSYSTQTQNVTCDNCDLFLYGPNNQYTEYQFDVSL